jgi:hypothetical protein
MVIYQQHIHPLISSEDQYHTGQRHEELSKQSPESKITRDEETVSPELGVFSIFAMLARAGANIVPT